MKTKGVSLLGVLRSLEAMFGRASREAIVDQLPDAVREAVRLNAILSGSWYPVAWYRDLHAAAQRVTGRGPELARELARQATLADFRGIYRMLTFVLSPEGLLRKAPSAWSRYYDSGVLEIREARDDFASVRFSGCIGFDESLWQDAIGGCVAVLEVCGAKDVDIRVLDGGRDGDATMVMEARWSR